MAKILETLARGGVDGERDYGEGAAAVASAMAQESEGEELGGGAGVCGVDETETMRSAGLTMRVLSFENERDGWNAVVAWSMALG